MQCNINGCIIECYLLTLQKQPHGTHPHTYTNKRAIQVATKKTCNQDFKPVQETENENQKLLMFCYEQKRNQKVKHFLCRMRIVY